MKKIYLIIFVIVISLPLKAQNLIMADYKPFHFGFCLGINMMDYGIKNSLSDQSGMVYQADVSLPMPGFTVGVLGDVRLNNYFNFRLVPTLSLGERTLTYMNNRNDELYKTTMKSTVISVPLLLKYSAVRINNYRPYLIAGGGVAFELSHDKTKPVLQKYTDFYVEIGVGCTFYTEYFRFAPELKFSIGLRNVNTPWEQRLEDTGSYLDPSFEPYSRALSRLTTRMFSLVFNFE